MYNPCSMTSLQHHSKSCHQQWNDMRWFTNMPRTGALHLSRDRHSNYTGAMVFQRKIWAQLGWKNGLRNQRSLHFPKNRKGEAPLKALFTSSLKSLLRNKGKIKKDNSLSLRGSYFETLILSFCSIAYEVMFMCSSEVWLLWLFLRTVTSLQVIKCAGVC